MSPELFDHVNVSIFGGFIVIFSCMFQKIEKTDPNQAINPHKLLSHSLGSLANKIIFGRSWPEDDPLWIWLQEVQDEGVQLMGVAGPMNFLPFIRY